MDGFLRALLALIAALNAATGAPVDTDNMPDRPPIVAPTMERIPRTLPVATSAVPEPAATTTITGTISGIKSGLIVVNGKSITLTSSTQVKGQLKTGVSVSVVVRVQPDGTLEAEKLEVGTETNAAVTAFTPTGQASANSTATTQTPGPGATPKPGAGSTETPEAKSTEPGQPSPTVKPQSQPTGQPQRGVTYSAVADQLVAITGFPRYMHSATARPNPSDRCSDTNASQAASSA